MKMKDGLISAIKDSVASDVGVYDTWSADVAMPYITVRFSSTVDIDGYGVTYTVSVSIYAAGPDPGEADVVRSEVIDAIDQSVLYTEDLGTVRVYMSSEGTVDEDSRLVHYELDFEARGWRSELT